LRLDDIPPYVTTSEEEEDEEESARPWEQSEYNDIPHEPEHRREHTSYSKSK